MFASVPLREYLHLVEAERKLNTLMKYGVENWKGYGEAMSSFLEEGITAAEAEETITIEHSLKQGDIHV